MPEISVIVPVYKVEPYLCRCVDSILAQTFTDFELILVDDGSPDNSGAVCDEYAEKDERIHVIHQQNGGLSAARNAGIDWVFANSDSRYISFIDSDDWVHQDYLKLLFSAVEETGSKASCCLYTRTLPTGEELDHPNCAVDREVLSYDEYFSKTGWGYTPYIACAKLIDKTCFSAVRFPAGKLNEDLFTTYRLLFPCATIARVNEVLYYYYQSEQSIMRNRWTPARMDEVEGSMELFRFMRDNNCKQAEKTAFHRLLWVLKTQISLIREDNYSSQKAEKCLLQTGRKLLLFGKGKPVSIRENSKDYDFFFPKLNWLFWTGVGVYGRIKKHLRHK